MKESLSPCVVPTVLSPKKYGGWRMCTDSREINKITIREENLRHLKLVLRTLQKENLLINLNKCSFLKKELVYLGFMVSEEGLKMDFDKVQAILNWLIPRNSFEIRSFHGLASFYRKFIKNFNQICAHLIDTFKGSKQPFQWTEATDRNFKLLKKKITEKPILALPSFDKVSQVETNASGVAIRVVLSQEHRPMAYFSENLNEAK